MSLLENIFIIDYVELEPENNTVKEENEIKNCEDSYKGFSYILNGWIGKSHDKSFPYLQSLNFSFSSFDTV